MLAVRVTGVWCALGFVLMSLTLSFTPSFSQLRVAPPSRNIWAFLRMSGVLWERCGCACFQLREEEWGGGRGQLPEDPCSAFAWESSLGYPMPPGHLVLCDWPRLTAVEDMPPFPPEPYAQASCLRRPLCQQVVLSRMLSQTLSRVEGLKV